MNEQDFIKEFGTSPNIRINYYLDDDNNVIIDEDSILNTLEEIKSQVEEC